MHAALAALFDEHARPTHVSDTDVDAALEPIMRIAALVDKQMAEYRALHLAAKLAPHDKRLDGKQERIKQTFRVVQDASTAFIAAGERLADGMSQLQRYLAEDKRDVEHWERIGDTPPFPVLAAQLAAHLGIPEADVHARLGAPPAPGAPPSPEAQAGTALGISVADVVEIVGDPPAPAPSSAP